LRNARYKKALGDKICAELRQGKTLRSICHRMGIDPNAPLEWADTNPDFARQYARDLHIGLDVLGQQTRDEAYANIKPEDVPLARHRFDVNRWYLGKRAPKRWGDKIAIDATVEATLQIDVLIATKVLTEANVQKLTEQETEAWQIALSTIPRLLAPPGDNAKVIEATVTKGEGEK
jgi:hypothetical protein